jgi:hypothetical protein
MPVKGVNLMISKSRVFASAVLVFLLLGVGSLRAQIAEGSIVGIVSDPSSAIIPGASVSAVNVTSGVVTKTITTSIGYYEFPLLPAGNYTVAVEQRGFQRAVTAPIVLHSGDKVRIDITMTVGHETQSVEVTAAAPLVNATTTDLGTVIERRQIQELPLNGRSFLTMLNLEPGWNQGNVYAVRGGASLSGLSGLGNNYLLDGVDMSIGENNGVGGSAVSGVTGMLLYYTSIDAIQEMKATTGAASAEYGRTDGGTVTLTTKSGTNKFHGTAWEYVRNDAFTASTFIANATGLAKPEVRQNQFGANLGGPILHDKLFFFLNYEGARAINGATQSGNVPTASLYNQMTNPQLVQWMQTWYPTATSSTSNPLVGQSFRNVGQTNSEDTSVARVDGNFGKNRLTYRMSINDQLLALPLLGVTTFQYYPLNTRSHAGSWTYMISPTMTNIVRFGYNYTPLARHIGSTNTSLDTNVPGVGEVTSTSQGYSVSASGLSSFSNREILWSHAPTYSVVDDVAWVRGAHTVKTGITIRKTDAARTQNGLVVYTYNSLTDLINDNAASYTVNFGNPGRGFTYWSIDPYLQDNWQVNRRLAINYGLHYSYFQAFHGSIGLATSDPFGNQTPLGTALWHQNYGDFSPRIGIVYSLTGDGKTIARAGFGTFYGSPQPWNVYNSNFISDRFPLNPTLVPSELPSTLSRKFPSINDAWIAQVNADPTIIPTGLGFGRYGIDPNHKDQYSEQYNFTLERQLTPSLVVNASYVGSRVLHEYSTVLENPVNPTTKVRPYATIGPVTLATFSGRLWFNGLETSLRKRTSHGISFDAFYTYSKSMQWGGADTNSSTDSVTQDFSNIQGSSGLGPGEVKHRFQADYVYVIPTGSLTKNSAVARGLLANWSLVGIVGASSGPALNVVTGTDQVGVGYSAGQRPDPVAGVSPYLNSSNPRLFLNPAAFDSATPKAQKRFGYLGFDTVRGPGAFTWDASVHKSWKIRENQELTFRLEMFNWLNHPVLGNPGTSTSSSTFGQINGSGSGRQLQLALRYSF